MRRSINAGNSAAGVAGTDASAEPSDAGETDPGVNDLSASAPFS